MSDSKLAWPLSVPSSPLGLAIKVRLLASPLGLAIKVRLVAPPPELKLGEATKVFSVALVVTLAIVDKLG